MELGEKDVIVYDATTKKVGCLLYFLNVSR